MLDWMLMPYRRYADFNGRSQRKEYWMFTLFSMIVVTALVLILMAGNNGLDEAGNPQPGVIGWLVIGLLAVWVIGSLVPSIAVTIRRLHDQDKSGWYYLLGFIPYVGGLIMLVFMCIEGTRGPNRFGADPKNPSGADVFS